MATSRVDPGAKAAFYAAVAITLVAVFVGDRSFAWLVAPVITALAVYAMAMAPLRSSLLVLSFLAFTLENPQELPAAGGFQTPFFMLGAVVLNHMNRATGVEALFFSGMDLMLLVLGVVAFSRRSSGSKIDRLNASPTPKPLIQLAWLSLGAAAFTWVTGMLRGGHSGFALWQLDRVVYLPLVFLLFQAAVRGLEDLIAFGKVIVAAGVIRALQAAYIQYLTEMPADMYTGERSVLPYATSHHDSMLFAYACVLLMVVALFRARPKAMRWALLLLPILFLGMQANNRRMVWVQILLVFTCLYFITPPNAVKRKVKRLLWFAAPVVAIYTIVGWSSAAGVFKPVRVIRSAVDSSADASTMWRDVENFDLVFTMKMNPIFGTGYGHGFIDIIPLPQVDYALEKYIPHNSILGLWTYCGYVGYTAMTLLWVAGVFFAIRAYHHSKVLLERVAALCCFAAIPIYFFQCYGDMGLGAWTGVFMMAPALAGAAKLATATGAWPVAQSREAKAAAARVAGMGSNAQQAARGSA